MALTIDGRKGNAMRPETGKAGFSLVEVTLALLVVAVGLTATFALFPEGLKATRSAVDDTEISLFAEYVFTTLDVTAIARGAQWAVPHCAQFKSKALAGDKNDKRSMLKETGDAEVAVFYWVPDSYGLASSADMNSTDFKDFWTSAFTYRLALYDFATGSTYAQLTVWPGEYEQADELPEKNKRVFTRAIQVVRGEPLK